MDDGQRFLREQEWPGYEQGASAIRVVDLFSGCGGLTLGIAEAARRAGMATQVPLAIDFERAATQVFEYAFAKLRPTVATAGVEEYFGVPGTPIGAEENSLAGEVGRVDLLVGGPPCQGHSDLNNHTRRDDPRNAYYARMGRAAEVLRPKTVVVENVPSVRHDRSGVVSLTARALRESGYRVADGVASMGHLGVPQRRKRHLLLAIRSDIEADPQTIMADVLDRQASPQSVEWAIKDLSESREADVLGTPSRVTRENMRRMEWLFENDAYELPDAMRPACHRDKPHSYKSVYGRLRWDQPAQTITSGFGSMGQGRYVHPEEHRTLTPREAARLQFFPDWFDFTAGGAVTRRGAWARMIGNAVPPQLMIVLGELLVPLLIESSRRRTTSLT